MGLGRRRQGPDRLCGPPRLIELPPAWAEGEALLPGPADLCGALLIVRLRDHTMPDVPGPLLGLVRQIVSAHATIRLPFRLRLRRAATPGPLPILYAELRAQAGRRLRAGDWLTTQRVAWHPGQWAVVPMDRIIA